MRRLYAGKMALALSGALACASGEAAVGTLVRSQAASVLEAEVRARVRACCLCMCARACVCILAVY